MKETDFTEAETMSIPRQMKIGEPVSGLCREHGMSSATVCQRRAGYGGMDARFIRAMKAMTEERCRRLLSGGSGPVTRTVPVSATPSAVVHAAL